MLSQTTTRKGACLAVLLVAILAPFAQSQAQTVSLSTGDGYAPFVDHTLPEGGWHTALVRRVFASMGQQVALTIVPWKRALEMAARGEVLGSFSYVPTPERARDFLFSRPLSQVTRRVFMQGKAAWTYSGLDSLTGRRACMELGSANPPEVQAMIARGEISLDQPRDLVSCARMLAAGRVDFFVLNDFSGLAAVRAAGVPKGSVVMAPIPYAVTTQHFLISRTYPDAEQRMQAFDAALQLYQAGGEYDALRTIYIGSETH